MCSNGWTDIVGCSYRFNDGMCEYLLLFILCQNVLLYSASHSFWLDLHFTSFHYYYYCIHSPKSSQHTFAHTSTHTLLHALQHPLQAKSITRVHCMSDWVVCNFHNQRLQQYVTKGGGREGGRGGKEETVP